MQPMPTEPTPQQKEWTTTLGLHEYHKMMFQMQHQSTPALDSAGSSTLHQIPEEHLERTGGQTGHALVAMDSRPPGDEDAAATAKARKRGGESEEAAAYSAADDALKNIVADRAFEEH